MNTDRASSSYLAEGADAQPKDKGPVTFRPSSLSYQPANRIGANMRDRNISVNRVSEFVRVTTSIGLRKSRYRSSP
jgi:hypothetical protein